MNKTDIINIGIEIRDAIIDCINTSDKKWLDNHISPRDLCGACGIASYAFKQRLLDLGYQSDFVFGGYRTKNNSHCWVEYSNDIIDITATQYDRRFESVEIFAKESLRAGNYISNLYNENALLSLRSWIEQDPLRYSYNWDSNNKLKLKYLG